MQPLELAEVAEHGLRRINQVYHHTLKPVLSEGLKGDRRLVVPQRLARSTDHIDPQSLLIPNLHYIKEYELAMHSKSLL